MARRKSIRAEGGIRPEDILRTPRIGQMFLGVDPATTTGVAVISWRGLSNPPDVQADQLHHSEVGDLAFNLVGRPGDLAMIGCELPFVGDSKRGAIVHAEASGWALGSICTALGVRKEEVWRPSPNEWRSMIPGMPQSPKAACQAKEWEIATGLGLRGGPRGGRKADAAAAVCIAWAAAWRWMATGAKTRAR